MINAQEAKAISNAALVSDKMKLITQALLDAVNERIKTAASVGKTSITLGSLGDNGSGIRGIGHYLSAEVTNSLAIILIEKGFKVDYETPDYSRQMVVKVSW